MIALDRLAQAPLAPGHVVALKGEERLTWDRFRAEVGGAARQLAGCQRAALLCNDSWAFAVGLFGLLSAGAEVVVPPNAQPDTLTRLRGDVERVVDDGFTPGSGRWSGPIDRDGGLLQFQTSGSTGEAKCVRRSLGQLDAEIAALHGLWGADLAGATALSMVPHQHVYGLIFSLLWPLAAGRPFRVGRHDLWEDLPADCLGGAVLVSSPAHLTRLGGLAPLAPERRPRMVLSAGAPLPESAAQEARTILGVAVTEIYGSTETGAMASRLRQGGEPAWRPLPGYAVGRSEAGLLRLTAPGTVPGGCLEIADRIEEAEDGGFHLLGRADRIAKIEGKRIALDQVERALAALPEIQAAAVLVLAEPRPVLAAVAVPSPEGRLALEAQGAFRFGRLLRRKLSSQLEPAGMPRRWRFVPALPEAGMGKRRQADLAALFEEEGHG